MVDAVVMRVLSVEVDAVAVEVTGCEETCPGR
jgi:hypothetical protein